MTVISVMFASFPNCAPANSNTFSHNSISDGDINVKMY